MGEDSVSNKSPTKSAGTPDSGPKKDGTKTPLTTEPQPVPHEAKYERADSKIDMGTAPVFSGLTKEELMKYSNDPFWIRLRMFLFILFWVAWVAMLVLAIVIIVQAPGCKPPPELLWVEEQALIEVDPQDMPTGIDLEAKMASLGIASLYLPNFISATYFNTSNYDADDIIKHLQKLNKQVVTDIPASISKNNPWYNEASARGFVNENGSWNYKMENLTSAVFTEILSYWISEGVTGFLMDDADTEEKKKFKEDLNLLTKEKQGAVGSGIVDFESEKKSFTPDKFRAFLENSTDDWSFYKFDPTFASSDMTSQDLRLVIMGLFLYSGTPVLKYTKGGNDNTTNHLITQLSKMRSLEGIKLGATNFANTTRNVVAYTRTHKGTPAYAIALNFNNGNETVSFKDMPNIGDSGTAEIDSSPESNIYDAREKYSLGEVYLSPYQALVLQFVANY